MKYFVNELRKIVLGWQNTVTWNVWGSQKPDLLWQIWFPDGIGVGKKKDLNWMGLVYLIF